MTMKVDVVTSSSKACGGPHVVLIDDVVGGKALDHPVPSEKSQDSIFLCSHQAVPEHTWRIPRTTLHPLIVPSTSRHSDAAWPARTSSSATATTRMPTAKPSDPAEGRPC